MQATMNPSALALSPRLQFARRGYMLRSEKRRRTSYHHHHPDPRYDRPPRRRRDQAGFLYKLLMVILLLTLWPIGLILLWRRKLRWSTLTKLFTSVITLMACVLLIGFALTVETDNPRYTAMQDSVNSFLDSAADSLIHFSAHMGERAEMSLEAVEEIRDLYRADSLNRAADAIDWGVGLAQTVREKVSGFFENLTAAPEATPIPEGEETAEPEETEETEPADVDAAETEAAEEAEETEAAATGTAAAKPEESPAPTSAAAAEIAVGAQDDALPVYIPKSAPDPETGTPVTGGMLMRSGELDEGGLATPEPEEELVFTVKPAGEATVYFNIGSGRYYHTRRVCGSMKDADTHSFAEVARNIHEPCERCNPPARELLDEPYIVWMDENNVAHLSDECAEFEGTWSLISAEEANRAKREGCAVCGADRYLAALAAGEDVALEGTAPAETPAPSAQPTPEPTPEPTLAPTPEPSPQVVTPRETLKPASRAIVYHSSNGRFYHMNDHCSGMTGGSPYSLSQCVADGYKQCNTCNAPAPEALDQLCLWQDEDRVCHVSDECDYFVGQYALVERDAALEAGLVGCSHCGAADYLIPFTVMSPYQTLDDDDEL